MRENQIFLVLSLFFAFLLSFSDVHAIAISPSIIDINFEPNFKQTYQFYVREDPGIDINVSVTGDLAEYITTSITEPSFRVDRIRYFSVTVELPEEIEVPGLHKCYIHADEIPPLGESGSTVAAYSGVKTPINIWVPYPEKYIEARLTVPNVNVSEPVRMQISLISRGLSDTTAYGVIRIRDLGEKNIATLYTDSKLVKSMQKESLEAIWDTSGVPPGRYSATAEVEYGGKSPAISGTQFKIGDLLVKITNITYPEEIRPDRIHKLEVEVDSYWNMEIKDIYIQLSLSDDKSVLSSSKSETFDLDAWGRKTIPVFLDTTGIKEGEYDLTATVYYEGRTTEESVKIEIKEPSYLYILIIILVAIIVVVMLALFLLRKRKEKKKDA